MAAFVYLVIWLTLGYITMLMARKRGRNEILAFALGFLLGLFAIIGYAIAGNKNKNI